MAINLSFDGVLKTSSFDGGAGWIDPLPIFICENNGKSTKSMRCIGFFSGSFEDMGIFHVFQLTVCPGSSDPPENILDIFASENEVYTII